jgi:putative Holliday junction resolvase
MSTPEQPHRSLVALDYGKRRIGVATGSVITGSASALTTVSASAAGAHWPELDKIVQEWGPDLLVVGLPCNADGSENEMTKIVRTFGTALAKRYNLPLDYVDERYTSAEAEAILKHQRRTGVRQKKLKKEDVDATAAQLIAESWMQNAGAGLPS